MAAYKIVSWLIKLFGIPSLTVLLMNAIVRFYRLYQRRRHQPQLTLDDQDTLPRPNIKRAITSIGNLRLLPTYERQDRQLFASRPLSPTSRNHPLLPIGWGSLMVASGFLRSKKKLTLSLKNTLLWNPSKGLRTPNHAFRENAVLLLRQLCQTYDVYLLIKLNSDLEGSQIRTLLKNASIPEQLDTQHIIYCSTDEEKIQVVRSLSPFIHIEGGWELDDGANIIRKLYSHTCRLFWVNARRRRLLDSGSNDDSDQDSPSPSVEIVDSLWDTFLAHPSRKLKHTYHPNTAHLYS